MNIHHKKMIAPIIIVFIIMTYYFVVGTILLQVKALLWIKACIFVFLLGISLILIWVLIDRINEIKKGEEDDLSKY